MSNSPITEYIDYRLNQAKETLEAARSLARDKYWNSVINRLYYSCFYAISALLYSRDINAKSNSGSKSDEFYNFVPDDDKRSDINIHRSEQTYVPGEISH
jgi:uncharacterized protein (UPF0332 family)